MISRSWLFSAGLFVLALLAVFLITGGEALAHWANLGATTRVSIAWNGIEANDYSYPPPAISGDGRFVAFPSMASNLVPGDTNRVVDIFVHDRQTGATTRVSIGLSGANPGAVSSAPAVSSDGRYVAFRSEAANLVTGDTNGAADIFVFDRVASQTTRVSVATGGAQANGESDLPALSADGRYVAFDSYATNLVAGDTNGTVDTFVHDRNTGVTTRVSVANDGTQASAYPARGDSPAIVAGGGIVAFASNAPNLVAGDTNGVFDIFVRDWTVGETARMSVATGGLQGNGQSLHPAISADGRYVAFQSEASNLVAGDTNNAADVFVRDRVAGTTVRASIGTGGTQGNGPSGCPALSGDGHFVAFCSHATNLVTGDGNYSPDIFLHDLATRETIRVSVRSDGTEADGWSSMPAVSYDGRYTAFVSAAGNLVPADNNHVWDIFVHDRLTATATPTPTPTRTRTPSPTPTHTRTITPGPSPTPTKTPTRLPTHTPYPPPGTDEPTATYTPGPSPTPRPTGYPPPPTAPYPPQAVTVAELSARGVFAWPLLALVAALLAGALAVACRRVRT